MNDHWNRSLEVAFASLYIGDSQTMAAEAGVLGVPFVRFNDFVGRLGESKMANMDQKIELKENGEENDIRKIQRKQDDKPKKQ